MTTDALHATADRTHGHLTYRADTVNLEVTRPSADEARDAWERLWAHPELAARVQAIKAQS